MNQGALVDAEDFEVSHRRDEERKHVNVEKGDAVQLDIAEVIGEVKD